MSIKCESHTCKSRLTAGITLGLIALTIAIAELVQVAQLSTPFLVSPAPF